MILYRFSGNRLYRLKKKRAPKQKFDFNELKTVPEILSGTRHPARFRHLLRVERE